MNIAAHIFNKKITKSYLYISLLEISKKHPTHNIILFVGEIDQQIPTNFLQIKIASGNKISLLYWYKFSLPALLKKNNASCFISEAGLLSSNITLPQYLFCQHDFFSKKKSFVNACATTKKIFVTEEYLLADSVYKEKRIVVYHPLTNFILGNTDVIEKIKDKFTDGNEFIFFDIDGLITPQIITVLKAFSLFKKWQKTSIKLVITFKDKKLKEIIPDFKNYKYKAEVFFYALNENLYSEIMAASFLSLHVNELNMFDKKFTSLQNNIPILVLDNATNKSIFKNAALYVCENEKSIYEKIQALYKDEMLRKYLQTEAQTLLQKYDATAAAEKLYKIISA